MKSLGLAAWHQILFNSIHLTLICKALFTIHSVWVLNMCICVLALYICITLYNWYIAFFSNSAYSCVACGVVLNM